MKTERLIQKRKEKGYSVPELAKKLGIAKSTMYRYENGEIDKIPSHRLLELANILETTAEYLIHWSDEDKILKSETQECFTLPRPLTSKEKKAAQKYLHQLIKSSKKD